IWFGTRGSEVQILSPRLYLFKDLRSRRVMRAYTNGFTLPGWLMARRKLPPHAGGGYTHSFHSLFPPRTFCVTPTVACPMLSRVTSGRTPALLIRLECMVRKLRKSTVAGKPSFLIVGFKCRRSKLRRFTGPPFALVNTKSPGFRCFDRCQV